MENRGRGSEYDEEVYVLYYVSYIYFCSFFLSPSLAKDGWIILEFDSFFSRESEGKDRCVKNIVKFLNLPSSFSTHSHFACWC